MGANNLFDSMTLMWKGSHGKSSAHQMVEPRAAKKKQHGALAIHQARSYAVMHSPLFHLEPR